MNKKLTLSNKLLTMGTAFLLVALASIGFTLWVPWELEGGAAAVNEAGRLRMNMLRMILAQQTESPQDFSRLEQRFEAGLELLRTGDPARPLFVTWSEDTRALRTYPQRMARHPRRMGWRAAPQQRAGGGARRRLRERDRRLCRGHRGADHALDGRAAPVSPVPGGTHHRRGRDLHGAQLLAGGQPREPAAPGAGGDAPWRAGHAPGGADRGRVRPAHRGLQPDGACAADLARGSGGQGAREDRQHRGAEPAPGRAVRGERSDRRGRQPGGAGPGLCAADPQRRRGRCRRRALVRRGQ